MLFWGLFSHFGQNTATAQQAKAWLSGGLESVHGPQFSSALWQMDPGGVSIV